MPLLDEPLAHVDQETSHIIELLIASSRERAAASVNWWLQPI